MKPTNVKLKSISSVHSQVFKILLLNVGRVGNYTRDKDNLKHIALNEI